MNGEMGNRAEREEARLKLLNEGVDSYLDAMVAIREFRREIQFKAQEVLEKRLPELCDAMRLDPSEMRDQIGTCADDPKESWKGDEAWVAAEMKVANDLVWKCYFGICMSTEEDGLHVSDIVAAMEANNQEVRNAILTKCQEFPEGNPDFWGNSVVFTGRVTTETGGMAAFEEKLDKLIGLWIRVWNAYYKGKDARKR